MKRFVELYENYGCLSAEKRVRYSHGAPISTGVGFEKITAKLPNKFEDDGWTREQAESGEELLCSPWGFAYTWDMVLEGNSSPSIYAIDADGIGHRYKLTKFVKISRAEARDLYNSGAEIFSLPEGLQPNNRYFPPDRITNVCGETFEEMDAKSRENLCIDDEMGENMQYYKELEA